MHLPAAIAFILACLTLGCTSAFAQTVAVHSGGNQGHGLIFREGTTCYVILPRHVAAGRRSVTLFSAAPAVHANALIETPFWEDMDLAIGIVRGDLEKRCSLRLTDLDASAQPEKGSQLQLQRLRQSGELERIGMVITNSRYREFDAGIVNGTSEVFKGTSGAFLFSGETPAGMIIEALSPTAGRFIRIEEIFLNVNRWVKRRSGFAVAEARPASPSSQPGKESLFELASASLPPIDPKYSEYNLSGSGNYVFKLSAPNRIAFKAKGNTAVTLSKIEMRATPEPEVSIPRNVVIELSNTEDGMRTRVGAAAEMGPDGILDITLNQKARWVFITIRSAWDSTTVGLDTIRFE